MHTETLGVTDCGGELGIDLAWTAFMFGVHAIHEGRLDKVHVGRVFKFGLLKSLTGDGVKLEAQFAVTLGQVTKFFWQELKGGADHETAHCKEVEAQWRLGVVGGLVIEECREVVGAGPHLTIFDHEVSFVAGAEQPMGELSVGEEFINEPVADNPLR